MFLSTSHMNGRTSRRFRHNGKLLTQRWASYRPSRTQNRPQSRLAPTGIGHDHGDLHATEQDIAAYRSRRAA